VSSKSKKIRESARGADCQVRIPGICNFNSETTIPAHIAKGGMGQKAHDLFIAHCCSSCHAAIDGQTKTDYTYDELRLMAYDGMVRTQEIGLSISTIKVAA
jgi:hypothetical protein